MTQLPFWPFHLTFLCLPRRTCLSMLPAPLGYSRTCVWKSATPSLSKLWLEHLLNDLFRLHDFRNLRKMNLRSSCLKQAPACKTNMFLRGVTFRFSNPLKCYFCFSLSAPLGVEQAKYHLTMPGNKPGNVFILTDNWGSRQFLLSFLQRGAVGKANERAYDCKNKYTEEHKSVT